jgi:hypothetical protein
VTKWTFEFSVLYVPAVLVDSPEKNAFRVGNDENSIPGLTTSTGQWFYHDQNGEEIGQKIIRREGP